jgi:hypothetical protein
MAIDKSKPKSLTEKDVQDFVNNDPKNRPILVWEFPKAPGSKEVDKFWVRRPSRSEVEMITETAQQKGLSIGNDLLLNTCVLAGDMEAIDKDDDLAFGLIKELTKLMEAKKKN